MPGTEAWLTDATLDLLQAIVTLRTVEEAERFFRDLCTVPELHMLAARWQVAKLLDAGVHYDEIARRTGASTATISVWSSSSPKNTLRPIEAEA